MSSIYFHSITGTAKVSGSERAHFGIACSNLTIAMFGDSIEDAPSRPSILRGLFEPTHYVLSARDFEHSAKTHFHVGEDLYLNGDKIEMFSVHLNTAYRMGSDPVKLAARLHGQCELHCYVEGHNRKWLAEIIRHGRAIGFYRDGMGWESVIELLLDSNKTPVVTSYSVCDGFPNPRIAGYTSETDQEKYYRLSLRTQWLKAMIGLRESDLGGLELSPGVWQDYYFNHGWDANRIIAELYKSRSAA